MDELKKELSCLLQYFVERETDEEKLFIENQKDCELRLCISVSNSNCSLKDDKLGLLMIHTKLYQSQQLLDDNVNYDRNFYYIKSQTVSHCTSILYSNNLDNDKIMSIETVVTKDKSKCETVFKTFVTKSENGKKQKAQRSFTREISICQHSLKENGRHNIFSVISSEGEEENVIANSETTSSNPINTNVVLPPKPKLMHKLSKKSKFRSSKSLEKQTSIDHSKYMDKEVAKLQPIKRPKSGFKKFFKNLFHKNTSATDKIEVPLMKNDLKNKPSDVTMMRIFSTENDEMGDECTCEKRRILAMANYMKGKIDKKSALNNTNEIEKYNEETGHYIDCSKLSLLSPSKISFMRSFSTENEEMEKEKPTDILARIDLKNWTKSFEIIKDDIPFIDDDDDEEDYCDEFSLNRSRTNSFNESFIHFNFPVTDEINTTIEELIEKMPCDCEKRLVKTISESLILIASSKTKLAPRDKLDSFDNIHRHFTNCEVWLRKKKYRKYKTQMNQSQESLQVSDLPSVCKNIDNYFHDDIASIFIPFLEEINKKDKQDLCSCEEKKKKKIKSYLSAMMNTMKANGDFKNSFNRTTGHFKDCFCNFITPSINPIVDQMESLIDENEHPCNCDDRRLEILATFISSVIYKKNFNRKNIDTSNFMSTHFDSCSKKVSVSDLSSSFSFTPSPYNENTSVFDNLTYTPPISIRKRSRRKSSVSMDSIKYLDQMFEKIEMENKIECPLETTNYFMNCINYENYKKGLLKVLDSNATLENMILLFYLTRKIVRLIDDPNSGDNQKIKNILEFSDKYLCQYFFKEIENQGGLEKFILGIDSLD